MAPRPPTAHNPHRERLAPGKRSLNHYQTYWVSQGPGSSSSRASLSPARPSAAPRSGKIASKTLWGHAKEERPPAVPDPELPGQGLPSLPGVSLAGHTHLSSAKARAVNFVTGWKCCTGFSQLEAEPGQASGTLPLLPGSGTEKRRGSAGGAGPGSAGVPIGRLCSDPGRNCAVPAAVTSFGHES